MDFDDEDVQSDPESQQGGEYQNLIDVDDEDGWRRNSRSPTPVYNETASKSKPRKRLIKKSSMEDEVGDAPNFGFGEDDDVAAGEIGSEKDYPVSLGGGKRRKYSKDGVGRSEKKGPSERRERKGGGGGSEKAKFKWKKSSSGGEMSSTGNIRKGDDAEVKEMWDTIAGDSEDGLESVRNLDDDNFIDDTGIDPAVRFGDDDRSHSPSDAPQAEEGEDDEVTELFKLGRKKKKGEKSAAEIAMLVERVMAELEVVAEEDAWLNMEGKPAINKLKKLPFLTEVLSKRPLQPEFLDHGVLTLLKNWLEPLPDGSLPNITVRAAILKLLTDFPNLEHFERREQLKKSGLGKVIMFLSKSDEETTANRKLAQDLVHKWFRSVYGKSTRFEDMRNFDEDRVSFQRSSVKRPAFKASGMESRDDDLDLVESSRERKSGQSSSGQHASRPEAVPLDFHVRPQSKIDPGTIRARGKQVGQHCQKLEKKLKRMQAPKKQQLQAIRPSVEGRGMVKHF